MGEQTVFTAFAGVRLTADVRGKSGEPTVLLVHGGGQTHRVWEAAASALAEAGRHVLSIDLRGHGDGEWPADARYDLYLADRTRQSVPTHKSGAYSPDPHDGFWID